MTRGKLIVFEGVDGCGKTTQARRLSESPALVGDKMTVGAVEEMIDELLPGNMAEWDPVKIKNTVLVLCGRIRKQGETIDRLEAHVEALEEIEYDLRTKHGAVERR